MLIAIRRKQAAAVCGHAAGQSPRRRRSERCPHKGGEGCCPHRSPGWAGVRATAPRAPALPHALCFRAGEEASSLIERRRCRMLFIGRTVTQRLREKAPWGSQPGRRDSHGNPERQERGGQGQAGGPASLPPEPPFWKKIILWRGPELFLSSCPPRAVLLAAGGEWVHVWGAEGAFTPEVQPHTCLS